jgi:hypothetical protein
MNHHSLTLLLPTEPPLEQATEVSPPAPKQPAELGRANPLASLRFVAGVVANAAGFGMLLAGCWFSLQLMQLLVGPGA